MCPSSLARRAALLIALLYIVCGYCVDLMCLFVCFCGLFVSSLFFVFFFMGLFLCFFCVFLCCGFVDL